MHSRDEWAVASVHGVTGGRFYDPRIKAYVAKVKPGDYIATREDIALATTLGSCVSACIRDAVAGVGGMNHFLLPESEMSRGVTSSARYGSYAMEMLINEMIKQGARRASMEAKVFGGANVLRSITTSDVGERNAEFVHDYLAAEQIAIVSEDLGGMQARKVLYFPQTGRAMIRHLPVAQTASEIAAEQQYLKRVSDTPAAGDVELF